MSIDSMSSTWKESSPEVALCSGVATVKEGELADELEEDLELSPVSTDA
jgi:hypothetical protein